jgi:hypothetical protein
VTISTFYIYIYIKSPETAYVSTEAHSLEMKTASPPMSVTSLSLMKTRAHSLVAGTINPDCSKITLSGGRGAGMQKPRKRPIWLGHCLLSRLELNHETFQLPGALQMKEPLKHNNKRKLGRWIPREGRTGASTEHV